MDGNDRIVKIVMDFFFLFLIVIVPKSFFRTSLVLLIAFSYCFLSNSIFFFAFHSLDCNSNCLTFFSYSFAGSDLPFP